MEPWGRERHGRAAHLGRESGSERVKRPAKTMVFKTVLQYSLLVVLSFGAVEASPAAEESLGKELEQVLEPDPTSTPSRKHRKHSTKKPTPTPSPTASPKRKKASPTPSPAPKSKSISLSPDQIAGYENDPPKVRQILDAGRALAKQNLGYTYGSADPANGGMDCSGFIYYVLQQNGFPDVPRDSSQQYVWVRKAGNFKAVLSRKEDSFELDDLKAGDLLFWRGTYNIDRDPPITHTMIYLGREKRTKKRVMVGSSDGRTYDGKQRWGVSVFDFKIPPPPKSGDAKISPVFVGYGRIPGLSEY